MDMHEPYRLAVDEAFPVPQPAVVHDRFHIISHANDALNDVRKEEARELAAAGRDDLKGLRQPSSSVPRTCPNVTSPPSPPSRPATCAPPRATP